MIAPWGCNGRPIKAFRPLPNSTVPELTPPTPLPGTTLDIDTQIGKEGKRPSAISSQVPIEGGTSEAPTATLLTWGKALSRPGTSRIRSLMLVSTKVGLRILIYNCWSPIYCVMRVWSWHFTFSYCLRVFETLVAFFYANVAFETRLLLYHLDFRTYLVCEL